jgi:hypothetical protein
VEPYGHEPVAPNWDDVPNDVIGFCENPNSCNGGMPGPALSLTHVVESHTVRDLRGLER